jgi:hypothetical protein
MKNREKELEKHKLGIHLQLQGLKISVDHCSEELVKYKQLLDDVPLELKQEIQEDLVLTELYEEVRAGIIGLEEEVV